MGLHGGIFSHPGRANGHELLCSIGGYNVLISGSDPWVNSATRMTASVGRVGWKRVHGCDYTAWKNE